MGCHATAEAAGKQIAAIEANEAKEMSETSETIALDPTTLEAKVEKEEDKDKNIHGFVPFGIISFAELEKTERTEHVVREAQEVIDNFSQIAFNIVSSPDLDRETAMNNLVNELQVKMEQINKIQHGVVKDTGDADEVLTKDLPNRSLAQKSDFTVWKNADGEWKWMTIYSNKFRDSDRIPEIISEKSHKAFEALVDLEIVPPPELWLWHIPGSMWGKSEMVTYSDGFSIAFGSILPGFEHVAEGLHKAIDDGEDIAVSHGMPGQFLIRNEDDPTIIDFHITREISILPRSAAANKLTGFVVFKEQGELEMPIPDEKKEWLMERGLLDKGTIEKLESGLAKQSAAANEAGIESKETEEAETEVKAELETEDEVTEGKEEAPASTPDAEVEDEETKDTDTPDDLVLSREEIAEAMNAVVSLVTESNKTVSSRLGDIEAQIKELQVADVSKVKEAVEQIPTDSVLDLMKMSIIGQDDAVVDGRTKLAKEGPEETEPTPVSQTGSPFIDNLMNAAQTTAAE